MTAMPKLPEFRLREQIETSLQWSHDRTFAGHVFDAADPRRTFVVELMIDGHPVKCMRAADHVASLAARGIGDGCYGFAFSFAEEALQGDERIEARIANLGTVVGEPILLCAPEIQVAKFDAAPCGAIRWLGGLRLSGWIADHGDGAVDIFVDGEKIDRVRATGWSHIGGLEDPRPVRTFEYMLPRRFADGASRRFAATDPNGEHLQGSQQPFFASSEQSRHGSAARSRAAVIIVGADALDTTLKSLDEQSHPDWVAASIPEAGDVAGFDAGTARKFLAGEAAEASFVVFLLSGARPNQAALTRMAEVFANDARVTAVYGDVDVRAFALRRSAAERALGTGARNLYQVLNSVLDDKLRAATAVVHLPEVVTLLTSTEQDSAAGASAATGVDESSRAS